ncbi:hypothetical protein H072_8980 [Dactylellina haptotyla CBS 200.50]|uniref:Uncharacterized protein n=1 Tax=Dactylellina haptotyla (strain CBS 200.50) TaxID=1284197 RepID=S8A3Q6_DACHA|nr:hypothetical protein H072_8980 [Dactylellina haptotyla CBS 200.50]
MEDSLATPYPARMVTFLVSGTPISVSEELILTACPYSKLADIASYSLPGETATVNCPVNDFNALVEYLKTRTLDESDPVKLERLLQLFKLLDITIPEHLTYNRLRSTASIYSAPVIPSTSSQPVDMDNRPPTYDSLSHSGFPDRSGLGLGKIQTEPLTIQQKIALAVEERLTNLLMEHILPLVEGQATSGIYNGAFILVPSNSTTLQKPKNTFLSNYDTGPTELPEDEVISLSNSNIALFKYIKLVRLEGVGNTVQFLTQIQVIEELKKQLKARLQLQDPPPPAAVVIPQPVSPPPQKKSRWGWGRSSSSPAVDQVFVAPALPPPVPRGPIDIRIEEVSMRRMNHMGLYETTTGTVVVVEIFLS